MPRDLWRGRRVNNQLQLQAIPVTAWLFIAFILLTTFSSPSLAGENGSTQSKCSPTSCEEMIRRAQSAGEITVIVRLYIRNLPDPSQDSNVSERARTDDARASMVEEAQDTLLKQLPPERIKNPKRLKNFPIIGMTVDAIALESLINDPQVLSVAEDVPERQMLKESMPLIRADLGAWAAGYTGAGYAIAIIDTGVDSAHRDCKFFCVTGFR